MNPEVFTERSPGRLVTIEGGLSAFVPRSLPVDLSSALTPEVILELAEAESQLGRLDGLAANLPDPQLLIAPFLRREALQSSRIEGTQTTAQELVIYEARKTGEDPDAREVDNYIRALQHGVARIAEIPIGMTLFTELHSLLMDGTDAREMESGRLRSTQVYIASSGTPIAEARFVPPPAHLIQEAFDNLIGYLGAPDKTPLLIRLAVAHYQFEAIHPFKDGNGRIGRLLIVLMLCFAKRIAQPVLYVSAYFERRRQRYYDAMLEVSLDGKWEEWFLFFLRGISSQAKDAIVRTRELQDLRESYRSRLSVKRQSNSTLILVDELFKFPVITNRKAQEALGFSWQAANENVQKLVEAKIVSKAPGKKRDLYVADEIINIIDRA